MSEFRLGVRECGSKRKHLYRIAEMRAKYMGLVHMVIIGYMFCQASAWKCVYA